MTNVRALIGVGENVSVLFVCSKLEGIENADQRSYPVDCAYVSLKKCAFSILGFLHLVYVGLGPFYSVCEFGKGFQGGKRLRESFLNPDLQRWMTTTPQDLRRLDSRSSSSAEINKSNIRSCRFRKSFVI